MKRLFLPIILGLALILNLNLNPSTSSGHRLNLDLNLDLAFDLGFGLFLSSSPLQAQVVINEISPANNSVLMDEDGDTPDWIELYNSGATAVNIGGYKITDDILVPNKWIIPSGITIQPAGFLTLFASGKDRAMFFNHWETVVYADGTWKYTKPLIEPDSNWRITTTFNDGLWSTGVGGIGYGDGDDASLITQPAYSVYLRKVFTITDTSDIGGAVFHMDYDDAFVMYINGVEVLRSNIGVNGAPTPFNELAYNEHEAKMYAGGKPEQFTISEAFLHTFLKNGSNVIAIQVHNVDPWSSDMTALPWLSLGMKGTGTTYGPVPAWFELNAASLHTNFRLASNGETLSLIDPSGTLVSQRTYLFILADDSYGCQVDGSMAQRYFGVPTPGASNSTSTGYSSYADDPEFNPPGGFYPVPITLEITAATPGSIIHYTVDGSEPNDLSPVYTGPLQINSTKVVKARTYHPILLEGNVITNTYFINDSVSTTLPVISLSVDSVLLFDTVTGVYVKGPNAEAAVPFFGANFWMEKEVQAHIEFYDKQRQLGFKQYCGIEIYGNYSRSFPQKSFKVVARDAYGNGDFGYQLFPDKDIHSFQQFILRNAGTDWNSAHMRDALVHKLSLRETDCDQMAYQPCVVFINGKYWGVYNIREKINKDYINDNHDVDIDSLDILQYNGFVMDGSNERFLEMGWFVLTNDMTDPVNYQKADSMIDLENFADYFAIETWTNNWDWLTNNVRYWREQEPGGQWRWVLWDVDNGLGGMWSYTFNSLDTNTNKAYDYTSLLFSKLLTNMTFRNYFINRYADLLNTIFTPEHFNEILIGMRDTLDTEMPHQFERWGNGFSNPQWGVNGHGSYDDWRNYQLHELEFFAGNRQITARNHIQDKFNLFDQVPVTLNVVPEGAGTIQINTITIDEFPWAGIYFDSVAISVTAIPNPGFTFGFWQSGIFYPSPDTGITLTFVPDTSDVFTAYFFGAPDTTRVVFSEINYHSLDANDAGDWVELWNPGDWPFDLSGWKFKDAKETDMFVFPENTVLQGGEYLVLCQDLLKFNTVYPSVTNVMGDFGFGLSSLGESVRLVDPLLQTRLRVDFNSIYPWSPEPNGTGVTLELLDEDANLNDPGNWFPGCPLGSPGGPFVPCANDLEEETVVENDGQVDVHPNPMSDHLNIEISQELVQSGDVSFVLYDLTGSPVLSLFNLETETEVQRSFAPGIYMFVIRQKDDLVKTGKIVVLGF